MKNSLRFFVPPAALASDSVTIVDRALAHQISHVLRLQPGDRVLLLDGLGSACEVELSTVARDAVRGLVRTRTAASGEAPLQLTIFLALIRAERFEWALQKSVELGAVRLVPVVFARSLPGDRADAHKLERWRRIIREAAEQSCRSLLPQLDPPLSFAEACVQAAQAELPLLLWEGEAPSLRELLRHRPAPTSLSLISGPIAGIRHDELILAQEHGIMPVSLGPRLLRAETAPIVATAAIMYEFEA